jgi:predicted dehydrogenase
MAHNETATPPVGIACLGITHPHTSGRVRALRRLPGVQLLGAADNDELITPFCEALALERRSTGEILADPAVQAVLVHSVSESMVDLACAALEAGKAVLVEKPAGRNDADLERLVRTVSQTRGLCQVGYCYRFSPAVAALQNALDSGRLGRVLQVRAHAACSLDEAGTSHVNQPDDIGGALFVIGCHLFDLILHHFGMPHSVNARVPKFAGVFGPGSREDAAGAILSYPDKLVVVDFFSWDPLPWIETWGISAYGTEGVMHARPLPASYEVYDAGRGAHPPGWTHWSETSFPIAWAAEKTAYTPELAEIGNPVYFDREMAAFVDCLRSGQPSPIPATHARDVVALIQALYDSSARSGAEVSVASRGSAR